MSPKTSATTPEVATPSSDGRYRISISPYYFFMLEIERWLKGRSLPEEAGSLLCAKLAEREVKRNEMLDFIAGRLNINRQQLIRGILDRTIAPDLSYTAEINTGTIGPETTNSDDPDYFDIDKIRDAQCGS